MLASQRFEASDLPSIGVLILLEGLLSADNALVLALMVQHLPGKLRNKALTYGLGGAFLFRAAALLFAGLVLSLWWLQLIGAGYLLFIALKHFISELKHATSDEPEKKITKNTSFWMTILLIELTDVAFAVDSVLAAIAFIGDESKLWVAYAGAMIGVILLRFAASFFTKLLDKYPSLEHIAFGLVGWVGVKLMLMAGHSYEKWAHDRPGTWIPPFEVPEMTPLVFWGGMGAIALLGGILIWRKDMKKS